jgi:hypothetical protein
MSLTPFGRNKSATHYLSCPSCAPHGESIDFASNKRITRETNLRVEGVGSERPLPRVGGERLRRPRLNLLVGKCKLCRGGGVIAVTAASKHYIESARSQSEAVRYATEAVEAYRKALQQGEV